MWLRLRRTTHSTLYRESEEGPTGVTSCAPKSPIRLLLPAGLRLVREPKQGLERRPYPHRRDQRRRDEESLVEVVGIAAKEVLAGRLRAVSEAADLSACPAPGYWLFRSRRSLSRLKALTTIRKYQRSLTC
jgi:hypothetical protein